MMFGMSAVVKGWLNPSTHKASVLPIRLPFSPTSMVESLALLLASLLFWPATVVVGSLAPLLACFLFFPATTIDSFNAGEL